MYYHSFSFDATTDAKKYGSPEVEVLDYAYGDSHHPRTYLSKADRETLGSFVYQRNTTGPMPRGDCRSVQWRVKATDEVCEDRVDLRRRLPTDVANYGIHFLLDGVQLYVYAFPPYETKDAFGRVTIHGGHEAVPTRGQAFRDVAYNQQHQIYPAARVKVVVT